MPWGGGDEREEREKGKGGEEREEGERGTGKKGRGEVRGARTAVVALQAGLFELLEFAFLHAFARLRDAALALLLERERRLLFGLRGRGGRGQRHAQAKVRH